MLPLKRILLATDFSKESAAAQGAACELSRSFSAELTLLHVYEPIVWPLPEGYILYTPEQLTQLLGSWQKNLDQAQLACEKLGAAKVNTSLVQGSIATSIVEQAEEGKFDLVVIGTHGRKGISHALLGSVAERVVRHAPCPVLTVRPKA